MHNLIFALCFGFCFLFGLFFAFFAWELGLGVGFLYAAWECLGYAWDPKFPSWVNVCFVQYLPIELFTGCSCCWISEVFSFCFIVSAVGDHFFDIGAIIVPIVIGAA